MGRQSCDEAGAETKIPGKMHWKVINQGHIGGLIRYVLVRSTAKLDADIMVVAAIEVQSD